MRKRSLNSLRSPPFQRVLLNTVQWYFPMNPVPCRLRVFRTLRTSLSLLGDESSRQIILFTSAIPAEGKSFTSVNAGIAFASENLKTLLIDADLRRPRLAEIVLDNRQEKPAGLTNYLSDLSPWRETLQKTQVENLFLLSAGERAPNPAELLALPQVSNSTH